MNEVGKEGARDRKEEVRRESEGEGRRVRLCTVCGWVRRGSEALVVELVMCVCASDSRLRRSWGLGHTRTLYPFLRLCVFVFCSCLC